jgi:hypothetical protein
MKIRLFSLSLILAIGLVCSAKPASAQAYGTRFTTTLIYQNPNTTPVTHIQIVYYPSPDNKNPISISRPDLPGGKSTSVFIGTLANASFGFHGALYIQSEPHLVVIQIQTPDPKSPVKVRPITNLPPDGSPTVLFASVLRNSFYANTILTIQNTDSQNNVVRLDLYNIDASLVHSTAFVLAPGEVYIFDAGKEQNFSFPDSFNGSAVVTATRMDMKTPGKIMGSAMEMDNVHLGAKTFEGLAHGSLEVFMPSAACNFDIGGRVLLNTAYAVQNNSSYSSTDVTVTYSNGTSHTQTIGPGAKASFVACQAKKMPANFLGAATIRSSAAPVIAIGKAYGGGLSTAFTGMAADSGSKNLALPYIRWATDGNWKNGTQQRTFITIQNIGSRPIHGIIRVSYYPCRGDTITHVISLGDDGLAPGAKVTSSPGRAEITQFGTCGKGPQVGGSAIVSGPENSQLAAVVRVQQWDNAHGIVVGEDYNGINAP